jgi:NAD(P)H-flavin reductase
MAAEGAASAAAGVAGKPAGPDPWLPRLGRIVSRRRDSRDAWTLEIREQIPQSASFRPGQFNMLTAFGIGEVPISLSGDPAAMDRLIHTIRPVGPVSTALAQMRPGAAIGLRGPFGSGWPLRQAVGGDVLVVAGGLGLAPLRPVLYALLAGRERYGRITLLYGSRSPDDVLFHREIVSWSRRQRIEVHVTVDHAASGWDGHVGVVTTLVPRAQCEPQRTVALVCGPEVMMRLTVAALHAHGIPHEAIYLSMERNMKCALGLCGRCQLQSVLVCRDGPVFRYDRVRGLFAHKEL